MLKDLPLSDVYCLIEPGPVVMLSTSRNGRPNLMTMSWHMMVEFEPPMIACVVSSGNDSFEALRIAKECVIAIPDVKLAEKVVAVGNCHGRDLDKFAAVGLSTIPGERVLAPLISECFANLECKVVDTRLVNKFNLFVVEVLKAWIDPAQKSPRTIHHRGYGTFIVDGETNRIEIENAMRLRSNSRRWLRYRPNKAPSKGCLMLSAGVGSSSDDTVPSCSCEPVELQLRQQPHTRRLVDS